MANLTPAELEVRYQLATDFRYYAQNILKLRPMEGGLVPFIPTEQQMKLDAVAARQLRDKGRVRIIVAKGRKTRTSTYVQGRFYQKLTHTKGISAFIAAHDKETTSEIFDITDRFHRHAPQDERITPKATSNSARELAFASLDSKYSVGTAGSVNIGRGFTPQLLHLSEAAFFARGDEIARGLMSAVADEPGTEIWIESTGNGPGDWFHSQCMAAINGKSDFELVFLEWWLEPQYSSNDPIEPTEKELEMLATYPRLTIQNLAWRRKKIASYGNEGEDLFRREFPMSVADVFSASGKSFIPVDLVDAAVSREAWPDGPLVMGIDPGGGGEDPTAVIIRKGGKFLGKWLISEKEPTATAGKVGRLIQELLPKAIFVDVIGVGYHLCGLLSDKYPGVRGVDFRKTAKDDRRFANTRAECYDGMKEWLRTASIPDDQLLRMELSMFQYRYRPNGQLAMETKDEAKERGNKSPNVADALSITFAEPVEDGMMGDSLWNVWPHKPIKSKPDSEKLPECNFITVYAWLEDEQWAVAVVGVFIPDSDKRQQAGQEGQKANAIILRCITGEGVYSFMDSAAKMWDAYSPDYFYIPTRASIVIKDLRIKNLHIRKANFERVEDVVAVAHSVLKEGCAWIRNTDAGGKLVARLSRYPHGEDKALYGCVGLALAHLRQRGNLAVKWTDDEDEAPRRRKRNESRTTAY